MHVRFGGGPKPSQASLAFGVLMTVVALALLLILIVSNSYGKTVFQQLTVPNAVPSIGEVVVSLTPDGPALTELTPTESGTTTIYVRGTTVDPNGCDDLLSVSLTVHRADLAADCASDRRRCIRQPSVTLAACDSGQSSRSFQGTALLPYFADPTDLGSQQEGTNWVASATVSDKGGLVATVNSQGFEVNSLVSLLASSLLDFGTVTLGKISQPKPIYLVNAGNRDALPYVMANRDMACDGLGSQAIPASQLRLATLAKTDQAVAADGSNVPAGQYLRLSLLSDGARLTLWSQALALSLTSAETLDETVPTATGSTASPYEMYMLLKMPASGVRGSCSTELRVTALAR